MDVDGCPDADNDKDGILDLSDRCPSDPESVNGFQDEDGCPDESPIEDTDGDSYRDDIDRCPYDAEDFDEFQDEDGCPDLDNDNDGISDNLDQCPVVREIFNGVDDDDGCPDEGRVVVEKESIRIKDVIFFDTGKATIQARSLDLVQEIASVLAAHPELKRVRIEGHTDSVGNDMTNLRLSQDRADSVKKALVGYGVDIGRLDAVGFGEMRPIASNDNEDGRSRNRRVEFIIVERE
jgi:outer membrane protein OmpA-like peptidoglycan-associated protein